MWTFYLWMCDFCCWFAIPEPLKEVNVPSTKKPGFVESAYSSCGSEFLPAYFLADILSHFSLFSASLHDPGLPEVLGSNGRCDSSEDPFVVVTWLATPHKTRHFIRWKSTSFILQNHLSWSLPPRTFTMLCNRKRTYTHGGNQKNRH